MLALWLLLACPHPDPSPGHLVNRIHHAIEVKGLEPVERELRGCATSQDRLARFGLATIARLRYDTATADQALRRLVAEDSTDQVASHALLALGYQALGRASFDTTAARMERAMAMAARTGDSIAMVGAGGTVAFVRSRQGSIAGALEVLARVEPWVPAADGWLAGSVACNRASIMAFGGMPAAAAELERGLRVARQWNIAWLLGLCFQAGTNLAINRSGAEAVVEAMADSADLFQTRADEIFMRSVTRFVRGYARVSRNDVAGARKVFRDALEDAARSKSVFATSWVHRFMGDLYWLASDLETASTEFAAASAAFARLGDGFGLGGVTRSQGQVALELGRIDEAETIFRQLLARSTAAGNADGIYSSWVSLAAVRMARRDWAGARAEADSADRYARAHGYTGLSRSLVYLRGLATLRLGDPARAIPEFRAAAAGASQSQFLDRYAARSRIAEALVGQGKAKEALAEIRAAADELDSLRSRLDDHALRALVFQTRRDFDEPDVGFAAVTAGLARAGLGAEALDLAERRRARGLLDRMLVARTLESAVAGGRAQSAESRIDFAWLGADGALLEFVTGRAGQPTTVFVRTRDSLAALVVAPMDSLRDQVGRFIAVLEAGANPGPIGTRLWSTLLAAPFARLPAGISRVFVVTDDGLHQLPFDAVPDASGNPLMARFAITLVPSGRIGASLARRGGTPLRGRTLAFGNPRFEGLDVGSEYGRGYGSQGGLAPLPRSGDEARQVARYWPGAEVRLGAEASEAALSHARLDSVSVLHLATHAVADEQTVARTSLALATGDSEDGFVAPGELGDLRLSGGLVVLSACRTAGGVSIGGEGVAGLAAPLLGAGAGAVVASRWLVGDKATARFMDEFHRRLAGGIPVDAALRATKLAARERGEPAAVWAGFVAIGHGGLVLAGGDPEPRNPAVVTTVALLAAVGAAGAWFRRRPNAGA